MSTILQAAAAALEQAAAAAAAARQLHAEQLEANARLLLDTFLDGHLPGADLEVCVVDVDEDLVVLQDSEGTCLAVARDGAVRLAALIEGHWTALGEPLADLAALGAAALKQEA